MERLTYIIQPKDLKDRGFLHRNINDNDLTFVIYRVQETEIQPILGGFLYKRLLELIRDFIDNATPIPTTPNNYRELIYDYVIPTMIPYCEIRAAMHLSTQMKAAGLGTNVDNNLRIAEMQERKNLQEYLNNDALFYRNKLVKYLCDRKFPEYLECNPVEVIPEGKNNTSSNKFMFVNGGINLEKKKYTND